MNLETLELAYFQKAKMANDPLWQNITHVFQDKVSAFDLGDRLVEAGKDGGTPVLKMLNESINAVQRIKERELDRKSVV